MSLTVDTRSAFLLTVLNTIGAWILTSCACLSTRRERGGERGREDGGERGGLGVSRCESTGGMVQLVYAASLAATALFVGVERRHLMVSFPTSSPASPPAKLALARAFPLPMNLPACL